MRVVGIFRLNKEMTDNRYWAVTRALEKMLLSQQKGNLAIKDKTNALRININELRKTNWKKNSTTTTRFIYKIEII